MKILLLIFSFLNYFNIDLNKKDVNLKSNFEEVDYVETKYGDYTILESQNKVEILYENNRLILVNNIYHYKITNHNEVLTLFYKNNKNDYIRVYKFNKGKLSIEKQIDNKFNGVFDVIYYRNTYILVSSISEQENSIIINELASKPYLEKINSIIIQLNDDLKIMACKIYGGSLNDHFDHIYYDYNNDYIYIISYAYD